MTTLSRCKKEKHLIITVVYTHLTNSFPVHYFLPKPSLSNAVIGVHHTFII